MPVPTDPTSLAALPLVCDLIAAAMRSGAAVPTALAAAARTAPTGLRNELNRVAALLSLGTSAGEAWSAVARDPVIGSVAAIAARSADSGIRLADALSRCARSQREQLHAASVAKAESVGVLALLPLGLCFLPAFICLGVIPVVAGIAADVFSRVTP
jgi:pilus assembly protein TadC